MRFKPENHIVGKVYDLTQENMCAMIEEIDALRSEASENARIIAMSGEREAKHLAEIERLRGKLQIAVDALSEFGILRLAPKRGNNMTNKKAFKLSPNEVFEQGFKNKKRKTKKITLNTVLHIFKLSGAPYGLREARGVLERIKGKPQARKQVQTLRLSVTCSGYPIQIEVCPNTPSLVLGDILRRISASEVVAQ